MTTFANLGKVEPADAAWLNAWNSRYYFVRAYVTKEGNLIFDWDTLLVNVSPDDIVLTAKLFTRSLTNRAISSLEVIVALTSLGRALKIRCRVGD